jgi:cyclic-di-GMP-binding protein
MPADLQSAPFGRLGTDPEASHSNGLAIVSGMPSFDVVSEVDRQELKNAIDQAQREIAQRYDFKNTDSSIEQVELVITLRTASEDRLRALRTVLEERLVKRGVSLRGLDWGKIEPATGESVRQVVTVKVGISSDKAKEINKLIKEKGPKGVSSQTQGDSIRVSSKKRDDLQAAIALLKSANLGISLQFVNFRD